MFTTSKKTMGTFLAVACVLALGSFASSARASDWNGTGSNPYLAYSDYEIIALLDHVEKDNPGLDVTARWAGSGNPYLQYGETEIVDVVNKESGVNIAAAWTSQNVNPYLAYGDEEAVALMDRLDQDARMAAVPARPMTGTAVAVEMYQAAPMASDYALGSLPTDAGAAM